MHSVQLPFLQTWYEKPRQGTELICWCFWNPCKSLSGALNQVGAERKPRRVTQFMGYIFPTWRRTTAISCCCMPFTFTIPSPTSSPGTDSSVTGTVSAGRGNPLMRGQLVWRITQSILCVPCTYIDVQYHFLWNEVKEGRVDINSMWKQTGDQRADILWKSPPLDLFVKDRRAISGSWLQSWLVTPCVLLDFVRGSCFYWGDWFRLVLSCIYWRGGGCWI